jgi:hypothetical protein
VRAVLCFGCVAALAGTPAGGAALGQAGEGMTVAPPRAEIGMFYDGARVTVSCTVDSGSEAAILVSGAGARLRLHRQARVWGTFWAPSGEVTFDGIPSVYLLQTSVPLEDLAPDTVLHRLGLGYDTFQATREGPERALFPDLVRLKESDGLFDYSVGRLQAESSAAGRRLVAAVVDLPPKAKPESYRVQCLGFRNGEPTAQEEETFTLARGAFNALIGSLAQRHGLFYGVLAVVVAMGAGLFVGLVFGSVKGH